MKIETTLEQMRSEDDWNWGNVFLYGHAPIRTLVDTTTSTAPVELEHVTEIYASVEGENDGEPWLAIGHLRDGRYFFIEASCDYTGWDCQAGGTAVVASTLDRLVKLGIGSEFRSRLGILDE